jgi:hypothetical protein
MGAVRAVAPALAEAFEEKLAGSRAAETYPAFKGMCDPDEICVGFMEADAGPGADGAPPAGIAGVLQGGAIPDAVRESGDPESTSDPYSLWIIAPIAPGVCAVEFAGAEDAAAATFVYRYGKGAGAAAPGGDARGAGTVAEWDAFRLSLNMALEAIGFKREVIRLTEEEMAQPGHAIHRMAVARCEALRTVRAHFAGRAIHRSMDSWKGQLAELCNTDA